MQTSPRLGEVDFIHSFAHDLRHALRSIMMQAQRVDRKPDMPPEELKQRMQEVLQAARRQDELIRAAVEFEEARAHGVDRGVTAPLRTVLQTAVMKVDGFRREQNGVIRFEAAAAPAGPVPVGTAAVIEKVLHNALKFHPPDHAPLVTVEAQAVNGHLLAFVRDEGIGIPEQYRETVFQPFRKLNPASEFPGSGLALAVSAALMRSAGGTLTCDGGDPTGAVFRICWPADASGSSDAES